MKSASGGPTTIRRSTWWEATPATRSKRETFPARAVTRPSKASSGFSSGSLCIPAGAKAPRWGKRLPCGRRRGRTWWLRNAPHVAAVQAVKASIAALKVASTGIAAGLKTELDLLQARQQLEGARRDLNKARYEIITLLVKLKAAAGQLSEDDVQFLDKMFTNREEDPEELLALN